MLLLLAISITLLTFSQAGQITNWDISVDFTNIGLTKTYNIYFVLENGLDLNQYMKVVWPYTLGFATTYTMAGKWGNVSNLCADPDVTNPIEVALSQTSGDASFTYYIRFTAGTSGTFSVLAAGQAYYMQLIAPSTVGVSGIQGPIAVSTVSAGGSTEDTNYITYDSNPYFAYLQIDSAPSLTLTANFSTTDGGKNFLANPNYPLIIDIRASIAIQNAFKIFISPISDFSIVSGTCLNLASSFPSISLTNSTPIYTYSGTGVYISINEPLTAGRRLRFQCGIQNPSFVTASGLIIRTMWYSTPFVVEQVTIPTGLATTSWTWGTDADPAANISVYLGWGVEITSGMTNVPDCFRIYKNFDANLFTYNTIQFGFSPSSATPTGVEIVLTLQTINTTSLVIMSNTIAHNLPDAQGKSSSCIVNAANTLVCTGVGPLSSTIEYLISFKFYIIFSYSALFLPTSFGSMSITDTLGRTIVSAAAPTLIDNAIYANLNLLYGGINSPGNGNFRANHVVHAFLQSAGITASSTSSYGLFMSNDLSLPMRILFDHNVIRSHVSTTTPVVNDGIEYFTTPAVVPMFPDVNTASNCGSSLGGQTYQICQASVIGSQLSTPNLYYTRFRFATGNPSGQYPTTLTRRVLWMNNINITMPNSVPLFDQGVYDFYGRGLMGCMTTGNLSQINMCNNVGVSKFLMNGYVINRNALLNMHVGLSQFWTGTNAAAGRLNGSQFPAYIRVMGYFSTAELGSAQILAVFFNGLTVFQEPNGKVPCSTQVGSLDCVVFPASNVANTFNPSYLSRVLIDISNLKSGTSNVNRIQIVIPVQTINQFPSITLGVATMTYATYYYTAKNLYAVNFIKMYVTRTYTINSGTNMATLIDPLNTVNLPVGSRVGQMLSVPINNSIVLTQNDNPDSAALPNIYASMSYCGLWAWNTDDLFDISPIPNAVTSLYLCINVNYVDGNGIRHWCTYCPVESTLTTTGTPDQQTFNFILPFMSGRDMPAPILSWSDRFGSMFKYNIDTRTNALIVPSTINDLTVTTSPPLLYKSFNNYQISFLFTSALVSPANGIITISSTSFGFTVIGTALAFYDGTVCNLTGVTATTINCQLIATTDFPAGSHNFTIKGVDVAAGGALIFAYSIAMKTSTNRTIEQSSSTGAYTMINSATGYELWAGNLGFGMNAQGAITYLRWDFLPSKTQIFANEQFVFDLGNDVKAAQGSNSIICQVYEGSVISWKFKACSVTNLDAVTLTPAREFWINNQLNNGSLTVYLYNIIVPSSISTTFDARMIRSGTAVVVQQLPSPISYTAPTTLNTISGSNLVYTKKFIKDGGIVELNFAYSPTIDITNTHSIYIVFNTLFTPGLGYSNLYCTIDNNPVYCTLILPYTMKLSYFTTRYLRNIVHQIKIYGITGPKTTGGEQIFFALDNDASTASLVEGLKLADTTSVQATYSPLIIYNISATSSYIRDTSIYTILFYTTSGIAVDRILTIDFPDSYGNYFGFSAYQPRCRLTLRSGGTSVFATVCTTFGSRIKVTLSNTLSANTNYILTLTGVRNPDDIKCKQKKIILTAAGSDSVNCEQQSIPMYINAIPLSYIANPNLTTITLVDTSGNSLSGTPVVVTRGTFSKTVCFGALDDKFKTRFNVTLSPLFTSQFAISPNPIVITPGKSSVCFQISALQGVPLTFYDVIFVKNETSPVASYTDPPRVRVQVISQTVTISPQFTTYRIPQTGISLPIFFNLTVSPPANLITLTAALSSTNSIRFREYNILNFTVNQPMGYYSLKATSSAQVGDTVTLTLAMTGPDSLSYSLSTTNITLIIIAAPNTAFTYTASFTNNKKPTYQGISVQANQQGVVYWGIASHYTFNRSCDYIQDMALTFKSYNNLDYAQEQFGFAVLASGNSLTNTFVIGNLRSKQIYDISFCGVSGLNNFPAPKINVFSAVDNNIKIVSASFTFNSSLTLQQEIDFACFLAAEFRLFEYNVISTNRVSCIDSQPATPLPTVYKEPPVAYVPQPNDTSSLVYTRPTRLLIKNDIFDESSEYGADYDFSDYFGTRNSVFENQKIIEKIERNLDNVTTVQTSYTFLLYGNFESDDGDNFDTLISNKMQSLGTTSSTTDFTFKTNLYSFIANYVKVRTTNATVIPIPVFPSLVSGVYNSFIDTINPGFTTFPAVSVIISVNWTELNNVNLQSDGYVYAMACLSPSSTPNIIQIRNGLDANDNPAVSYVSKEITSTESGFLNISGLKNYTLYDIYFYGTNMDLSRFAITTQIKKITVRTELEEGVIQTWGGMLTASYLMMILLVIYLIV